MILLLLGCSCSDVAPPVVEVEPEAPRTIVMVIGCTLRADRIGAYGNNRDTTPYLDLLARDGAIFERMVANAPWTRPSIGSLSTGRYPLALGIDDPAPAMNTTRGVHPDFETIAEVFQAGGWTTVGGVANPNANTVFGLAQGFDLYDEPDKLWREEHSKLAGNELVDTFLANAATVEGDLYGQLVIIDTHKPLPVAARRPAKWGVDAMMNPTEVDKYDAALEYVDEAVARLDEGLKELGRGDRVLFVVGDHGEGLRTPSWAGKAHGRMLYDANVGTPWIAHGSGIASGNRVTGLAENVDLKPTLLELAELESEVRMDGDSRARVLQEGLAETGETGVFTETYFASDHRARWTTPEWTYIANYTIGSRKDVEDRGRFELYAADDLEQAETVYADNMLVAKELADAMEVVREAALEEQLVWSTGDELDVDMERALEALGYVEGQDGAPPE